MQSLFLDRETWLHRVPASVKLAALSALGTALFASDSLPLAAGTAAFASLLVLSLGPTAWKELPGTRGLAVVLLLIVLLHGTVGTWQAGIAAAFRVLELTLLGMLLTLTTRFERLLGVAGVALGPFRIVGLRPERMALGFGLMLRFVEVFFLQWQRLDEAHLARSGRSGGVRLLPPLALHVLASAERVGDALAARLGE
jgi:biotin transport system permease protein